MKNSSKTTKTAIRTEERIEDGFVYKYILNMEESIRVASYKLPLYSISVKLTDRDGNTTAADTKQIFADLGKAFSFFDMLVRNLATPIDLPYIVEDEISG